MVPSTTLGMMVETTPVLSSCWIISQEARPARAGVPSGSSAMPTATPMTNRICILSISAPPALTSRKPMICARPSTEPPCMVDGHTHQQTADGQHCDGQHQRLAQFLQKLHHKKNPPLYAQGSRNCPMVQAVTRRCWLPARSHLRNNIVTQFTGKSYRFFEKKRFICANCIKEAGNFPKPFSRPAFAAATMFIQERKGRLCRAQSGRRTGS